MDQHQYVISIVNQVLSNHDLPLVDTQSQAISLQDQHNRFWMIEFDSHSDLLLIHTPLHSDSLVDAEVADILLACLHLNTQTSLMQGAWIGATQGDDQLYLCAQQSIESLTSMSLQNMITRLISLASDVENQLEQMLHFGGRL